MKMLMLSQDILGLVFLLGYAIFGNTVNVAPPIQLSRKRAPSFFPRDNLTSPKSWE